MPCPWLRAAAPHAHAGVLAGGRWAGPLGVTWADLAPLKDGALPARWHELPPPLMGAASTFLLQLPLKLAICVAAAYRVSVPASPPGAYRPLSDAPPPKSKSKKPAEPPPPSIPPAPRARGGGAFGFGRSLTALAEETELASTSRSSSREGEPLKKKMPAGAVPASGF